MSATRPRVARTAVVVMRRRGLGLLAGAAGFSALLGRVAGGEVPTGDGMVVAWPAAPVVLAVGVAVAAARAFEAEEVVSSRSGPARRAVVVVLVAIWASVLSVVLGPWSGHPPGIVARDVAELVGLGLAGAAALPRAACWAPPLVVAGVCWTLPPPIGGGAAGGLLVLYAPPGDRAASVVAAGTLAAGVVAYLARGRASAT